MNKIKFIREKCIEANPEIVELKFGCEVKIIRSGVRAILISPSEIDLVAWNLFVPSNPFVDYIENEATFKIIGRPIRLADVLLAYSFRERFNATTWGSLAGKWSLIGNNLNNQSKETIDFIYDILKA